ncbi:hypothetical protein ACFY8S_27740 [Streptomyces hygroscopicus]
MTRRRAVMAGGAAVAAVGLGASAATTASAAEGREATWQPHGCGL